jgi:hypothetical protein
MSDTAGGTVGNELPEPRFVEPPAVTVPAAVNTIFGVPVDM